LKRHPSSAVHWTVDDHEPVKRKFELYVKDDFDLLFICHKDYIRAFEGSACHWLPTACDPEIHRKMNEEKIYDVVCAANLDPAVYTERVRLLEKLSKKFKVGMFHKLYHEDMVKKINQARIVFHKSFNGDLSTRVFETLCCGAFLLADRIQDGLPDILEDGKHLVLYDNYRDVEEKVSYYLTHENDREKIAAAGCREVREKHTFADRARTILIEVEKLKNRP
jgi:spore maturation protein CgeB